MKVGRGTEVWFDSEIAVDEAEDDGGVGRVCAFAGACTVACDGFPSVAGNTTGNRGLEEASELGAVETSSSSRLLESTSTGAIFVGEGDLEAAVTAVVGLVGTAGATGVAAEDPPNHDLRLAFALFFGFSRSSVVRVSFGAAEVAGTRVSFVGWRVGTVCFSVLFFSTVIVSCLPFSILFFSGLILSTFALSSFSLALSGILGSGTLISGIVFSVLPFTLIIQDLGRATNDFRLPIFGLSSFICCSALTSASGFSVTSIYFCVFPGREAIGKLSEEKLRESLLTT